MYIYICIYICMYIYMYIYVDMFKNIIENYDISKTSKNTHFGQYLILFIFPNDNSGKAYYNGNNITNPTSP